MPEKPPQPGCTTRSVLLAKLLDLLIALIAIGSGGIVLSTHVTVEVPVTPERDRHGWVEPEELDLDQSQPVPEFALQVVGDHVADSSGAIVKLWEHARQINNGQHFPTVRQLVGDCVAAGACQALRYAQAVDIATGRMPANQWRDLDIPWIYGISRTAEDLGARRLGRSDGSIGRWAALGVQRYGVLAADAQGVPQYTAERSRTWGYDGPPAVHHWQAITARVRDIAQVTTYEQARDALANGYPITIASTVGFRMQPVVRDGRHWGQRSGRWAHQMCLIGIDDTARSPFDRRQGAAYCLNSWGPTAHGNPADDAPPGGFWIDRTTIEQILRAGDSYALSNFDGFPARDPHNFIVFGDEAVNVELAEPTVVVEPVCLQTLGLPPQPTRQVGTWITLLALTGLAGRTVRRRRRQQSRDRSRIWLTRDLSL